MKERFTITKFKDHDRNYVLLEDKEGEFTNRAMPEDLVAGLVLALYEDAEENVKIKNN